MQLADVTTDATSSGFDWTKLLSTVSTGVTSAANLALQYQQARLKAQTDQAIANAQAQAAVAKATMQSGSGSMFNYGFGTRPSVPSISPGQVPAPQTTNYIPMILIGGFALVAAFLILGRK